MTAAKLCRPGRCDVEYLRGVGKLGYHGDGDEEHQDRSDALRRRDRVVPREGARRDADGARDGSDEPRGRFR